MFILYIFLVILYFVLDILLRPVSVFAFRRLSVLYAPSSDELLFLALSRSVVGEDKAE